jgi:TRAP-type C4-dicarboxylate transport system permease small subunit
VPLGRGELKRSAVAANREESMKAFVKGCQRVGVLMNSIAGLIMILMMGLTVCDVVLRFVGRPITGSYELMALGGAVMIGAALPMVTFDRGHIFVDLLLENASVSSKKLMFVLTRIPGIVLFAALTYYLAYKGYALYKAKEVSLVLGMPTYPLVYILSFCCVIECLALVTDIFRTVVQEDRKGEAK